MSDPSISNRSAGPQRTGPRQQFDLLTLLAVVGMCAVVFAVLRRWGQNPFAACAVGSVIGFFSARGFGRQGVLAAVLGGVVASWLYGGFMYLSLYINRPPYVVDYLGPFLTLTLLSFLGCVEGLAISAGLWLWTYRFEPAPSVWRKNPTVDTAVPLQVAAKPSPDGDAAEATRGL